MWWSMICPIRMWRRLRLMWLSSGRRKQNNSGLYRGAKGLFFLRVCRVLPGPLCRACPYLRIPYAVHSTLLPPHLQRDPPSFFVPFAPSSDRRIWEKVYAPGTVPRLKTTGSLSGAVVKAFLETVPASLRLFLFPNPSKSSSAKAHGINPCAFLWSWIFFISVATLEYFLH